MMRIAHKAAIWAVLTLLSAPLLLGQDLSKYREFSLGMSLGEVSKRIGQNPAEAKLIHQRPAVIQELTWWQPGSSGSVLRAESVHEFLFSFYKGELYKILATYDSDAVKGLTVDDLVSAISTIYGNEALPPARAGSPAVDDPNLATMLATWEDAQHSIRLVRFPYSGDLGLVVLSKSLNAQAESAKAAAAVLDERARPQREFDQKSKEAEDLENERQKNKKIFRP
jgi:hypothetical protein